MGTEKFRCSEDFYLMASADAPAPGEPGGPAMAVVSPDKGAMAVAGEIYTVEVSFVRVCDVLVYYHSWRYQKKKNLQVVPF